MLLILSLVWPFSPPSFAKEASSPEPYVEQIFWTHGHYGLRYYLAELSRWIGANTQLNREALTENFQIRGNPETPGMPSLLQYDIEWDEAKLQDLWNVSPPDALTGLLLLVAANPNLFPKAGAYLHGRLSKGDIPPKIWEEMQGPRYRQPTNRDEAGGYVATSAGFTFFTALWLAITVWFRPQNGMADMMFPPLILTDGHPELAYLLATVPAGAAIFFAVASYYLYFTPEPKLTPLAVVQQNRIACPLWVSLLAEIEEALKIR